MAKKINPFVPNSPVAPGMFVGRLEEVERLEAHLVQTRSGQPSNFMLTGERGIGKSSLMNYLRWVAQGSIPVGEVQPKFLVIDVDIDPKSTQFGLIRRIELILRNELSKSEPAKQFLAKAWEFLQRCEAAGVRVNASEPERLDEAVFEGFCLSLAQTCERVSTPESEGIFGARYDGILLLIDEADNGSKDLGLGSFLKLLTERLQRRGCNRLMIGLAGMPILRNVLSESHASSLRLFEEVALNRLTPDEVNAVINRCLLGRAQELNGTPTAVSDEARALLVQLSEGYPHFVQQFGYSAFAADDDNQIDKKDCMAGAFGDGGALELIGNRYYRDDFYNRIQKDSYRQILRIMAVRLDDWVTKDEIKREFKGTPKTLDNAIQTLKDRHIILAKEGERGVYRLQHKGFALWIRLYAEGGQPTSQPTTIGIAPSVLGNSGSVPL